MEKTTDEENKKKWRISRASHTKPEVLGERDEE